MKWQIVTKLYQSKYNAIDAVILNHQQSYVQIEKASVILKQGAYIILRCNDNTYQLTALNLSKFNFVIKDVVAALNNTNEYWIIGQKRVEPGNLTKNIVQFQVGCMNAKNIAPYQHISNFFIMHQKTCEYTSFKTWRCDENCIYKQIEIQYDESENKDIIPSFQKESDVLFYLARLITHDKGKIGIIDFTKENLAGFCDMILEYNYGLDINDKTVIEIVMDGYE